MPNKAPVHTNEFGIWITHDLRLCQFYQSAIILQQLLTLDRRPILRNEQQVFFYFFLYCFCQH